jgi:hypothetical protein
MKVRYLLPVLLLSTVACTPSQINSWLEWHAQDPEAAVEFANRPEIQAELTNSQSDAPQFAEYVSGGIPGNCESYVPLFQKYNLPVSTFKAIAWRESGCNHRSFVKDHDDLGGGLLGINLRAGRAMWNNWCGLTEGNVTNAEVNVHCAAEAYQRLGMKPWR